jgi:mRNA-degrading endonuclease toxin of MazEF toxin-antitoxin module
MKNFDAWNQKKKELEGKRGFPFIHEREIWWCSTGLNLGNEQDGKNARFERPVLVLKRFSANLLLVVPLTSQVKDTIYQYSFVKDAVTVSVILSQIRSVSNIRFSRKIGKIEKVLFEEIKWHILKLIF